MSSREHPVGADLAITFGSSVPNAARQGLAYAIRNLLDRALGQSQRTLGIMVPESLAGQVTALVRGYRAAGMSLDTQPRRASLFIGEDDDDRNSNIPGAGMWGH